MLNKNQKVRVIQLSKFSADCSAIYKLIILMYIMKINSKALIKFEKVFLKKFSYLYIIIILKIFKKIKVAPVEPSLLP